MLNKVNKFPAYELRQLALMGSAILVGLLSPAYAEQHDPIEHCRKTAVNKDQHILCLEQALKDSAHRPALMDEQVREDMAQAVPKNAGATQEPTAASLGSEQVVARDGGKKNREKISAERTVSKVSDFTTTKAGFFVIFLENGQIWRQRKSDSVRVRLSKKREYDVEIYRGPVSGYRMKIPALRKAIIVERLK